jgi:hypothetical protein
MDYASEKIGIYNKKFIPDVQMGVNFLGFLLASQDSAYASIFPSQGLLGAAVALGASANDSFDVALPFNAVLVTDEGTRKLAVGTGDAALFEQVPFENASGIPYYTGMKFLEVPSTPQANVRNGKIEFDLWRQSVGEAGDPDSITDLGSDQLRIIVDSITEAGVDHSGRICRVRLKEPVSLAAAYEDLAVQWDGSNNYVVSTYMEQVTPSTTEADYEVLIEGPTVRRNTDLSADPDYTFLGTVTGSGTGTTPTVFDISGQNVFLSTPGVGINDLWTIYQDVYTSPHFDGDGLPNLDQALQVIMDVEHYPHDATDFGRHSDIHPDTCDFHLVSGLQFNIQAYDAADKANHKMEIKDDLGAVRAWVDGDGNAQFQDLYVQGTEYIEESTIIEGDLTVEGDLTAGDDNTVDRFYGHLLRADFDKDVHIGQDLYVARHSYLGDGAGDEVHVAGSFKGLTQFDDGAKMYNAAGEWDITVDGSGYLRFTTDTAADELVYIENVGVSGHTRLMLDRAEVDGFIEMHSSAFMLWGGDYRFERASAAQFRFYTSDAANKSFDFINSGAGEANVNIDDNLSIGGNIGLGGTITATGTLQFNDSNLVSPSPLPLAGPAAVDNTYNGAATTLIGALNEALSSGSLDFNYDAGGSGLGREIIVDAGAVATNREPHPVTVTLTSGVTQNIIVTAGDDFSDYYAAFPSTSSRQIMVHVTGSTLGNNGWYIGTPNGINQISIGLNPPGGAESGISAVWYDSAIYGTPGGAKSLEAYLDSPTDSILGWQIFQSGSASFGVDASAFADPIVNGTMGLEWDFYGDGLQFTLHDTPSGNWTRIGFTGERLNLWDMTPQVALYYNFTDNHLNGGGVTKCQGFLDPVYAQDLATKNYVDNSSPLPPEVHTEYGPIVNAELGSDAVVMYPGGNLFQYRVTVPNGSPTNIYQVAVIMLQADDSFFEGFRPYAYGRWSAGGSKYLRWILKNGTGAGATTLYDSGNVHCPYTSNTWITGNWGSIPVHSNTGQLYRLEIYAAANFEASSNFSIRGVAHSMQYTNYAPPTS